MPTVPCSFRIPVRRTQTSRSDASNQRAPVLAGLLKIYEVGRLIVVGFGGKDLPSDYCIAESRQTLCDLVRLHDCKELVFDLSGVRMVPSGMLGVIASMRNLGVRSVQSVTDFRRSVDDATDTIIQIREIDISGRLRSDRGSVRAFDRRLR
jgi:hypothetical protein